MEYFFYYIEPNVGLELITKCEAMGRAAAKGGTRSKVYFVDDYVVIKANLSIKDTRPVSKVRDKVPFDEVVKRLNMLKNGGVNVVPILGYAYDPDNIYDIYGKLAYASGYIIEPKAMGKELWNEKDFDDKKYVLERIRMFAQAPQEQYNKFVKDFIAIVDAGIFIDPVEENFFYDEINGFSFIDLNTIADKGQTELNMQSLQSFYRKIAHEKFIEKKDLTDEEREAVIQNNNQIFEKYQKALSTVNIL